MASYLVLIHQIIAHIALAAVFLFFPPQYWFITIAVYCVLYCFGGTMTYHRLLSHQSFQPPRWFYYTGSILGLLSCSGSPIAWVATHRKHHRFTDKVQDPHSMRYMKWYKVQWLTMLVPAEPKYATHLLRSPFQIFLHKNYFFIHLAYAALLAAIDPKLLLYAYLAPAALVWEAGSIINTVCHKWGYCNYQIEDDSKNNRWLALFTFGEALHNNHHARQANFDFKRQPNEIDIAAFFIRLLNRKDSHPESKLV
jgi:stearoyl-CoA desaturase (delta-9 desaturase)